MRKIKLVRPLQVMFLCILMTFGYWLVPMAWNHDLLFMLLNVLVMSSSIFLGKAVAKEKEVSILTGVSIVLISIAGAIAILP